MTREIAKQFYNIFTYSQLYLDMEAIVENSPYHREASVAVHTDLVADKYLELTQNDEWTRDHMCGFLAAVFHDTGKPATLVKKFRVDRGEYVAFTGHELISARLWEDFAVKNWDMLENQIGLDPYDIYRIGWLIEHHLPYGLAKPQKMSNLRITSSRMFWEFPETFATLLRADCLGRISDDHETKKANVEAWIQRFNAFNVEPTSLLGEDGPTCFVLIGASGSGKSTFKNTVLPVIAVSNTSFSLDALRLAWYPNPEMDDEILKYRYAFEQSTLDNQFANRANNEFISIVKTGVDVVVDNTNLSTKRRAFYIAEARRRGYTIVGVLFPVAIDTLFDRKGTRPDKFVPHDAIMKQYTSLQYPSYGEVDAVMVSVGNLVRST